MKTFKFKWQVTWGARYDTDHMPGGPRKWRSQEYDMTISAKDIDEALNILDRIDHGDLFPRTKLIELERES